MEAGQILMQINAVNRSLAVQVVNWQASAACPLRMDRKCLRCFGRQVVRNRSTPSMLSAVNRPSTSI